MVLTISEQSVYSEHYFSNKVFNNILHIDIQNNLGVDGVN